MLVVVFLDGRSQFAILLSDVCQAYIASALGVFENIIHGLLTGNISGWQIKLLIKEQKSLIDIFKIVEANSQSIDNVPEPEIQGMSKSDVLMKVISWRKLEWTEFENMCQLVNTFVSMCIKLNSGKLLIKNNLHLIAYKQSY